MTDESSVILSGFYIGPDFVQLAQQFLDPDLDLTLSSRFRLR